MPQSKNLKMQWITIDGRQVPVVLPQVWDDKKQDWVVTSDINPLPTQDDLVMQKIEELNEKIDGIIDGTTPANTQLTGSNVEYGSFTNITISASESYRINRFKPIFKTVILTVRGGDPSVKVVDSLSVRAGFYHTEGGSPFVFAKGVANGEAGDSIIYATYAINVVSPEMVIDLTNKTDADLTIERMSVLGVE